MHGIIFERSAAELGTQPAGMMMMMMMMMPGSACDTPQRPQPKRKQVSEPVSAMRRRLAKHGDPRWTQEQCDSMTREQLLEHFKELGLTLRLELTVSSMEDYSPNLSWEELLELKAADEKAAAAAAADTAQPKRKQVSEPTSAMKRRLAEHGDPRWPQEQCDSMTQRQLLEHFEELGLPVPEKATFCILRQPEMLHLETRIYFTLSSVVMYEFPQYEFPQAVRLYEFPCGIAVLVSSALTVTPDRRGLSERRACLLGVAVALGVNRLRIVV
eukprot:COSAG05_NODE_14_length_36349_cov_27.641655_33_plen_270_part_01